MYINYLVSAIINTNHLYVEDRYSFTKCFYKFGNAEIGVILFKCTNSVCEYRTSTVPNTPITRALIEHCKRHIS